MLDGGGNWSYATALSAVGPVSVRGVALRPGRVGDLEVGGSGRDLAVVCDGHEAASFVDRARDGLGREEPGKDAATRLVELRPASVCEVTELACRRVEDRVPVDVDQRRRVEHGAIGGRHVAFSGSAMSSSWMLSGSRNTRTAPYAASTMGVYFTPCRSRCSCQRASSARLATRNER
jgi:hypothetical protein